MGYDTWLILFVLCISAGLALTLVAILIKYLTLAPTKENHEFIFVIILGTLTNTSNLVYFSFLNLDLDQSPTHWIYTRAAWLEVTTVLNLLTSVALLIFFNEYLKVFKTSINRSALLGLCWALLLELPVISAGSHFKFLSINFLAILFLLWGAILFIKNLPQAQNRSFILFTLFQSTGIISFVLNQDITFDYSITAIISIIIIGYIIYWQETIDVIVRRGKLLEQNISELEQAHEEILSLNLELRTAYQTTLEGWAKALELRDKETEGHSRRVTELTLLLATRAGFTEDEIVFIQYGALLHDIGKMGIPDYILKKPEKLTPKERKIIEQHPVMAYNLLKDIKFLSKAIDIPYCHHERWDGSGYPQGLREMDIPLPARVFAIVDVWDALTNGRSYSHAWSYDEAEQYLLENSGILFDPGLIDIFIDLVEERKSDF